MRSWFHEQRGKHQRLMARALSHVEWAESLRRRGDGVKGWIHVQKAIAYVVECGCDRSAWPVKVRATIRDGEMA